MRKKKRTIGFILKRDQTNEDIHKKKKNSRKKDYLVILFWSEEIIKVL